MCNTIVKLLPTDGIEPKASKKKGDGPLSFFEIINDCVGNAATVKLRARFAVSDPVCIVFVFYINNLLMKREGEIDLKVEHTHSLFR